MKRLILILCLLTLPHLAAQAILRGEVAREDQIVAAVQIWSMKQNTIKFLCSGTLIAPDVVVTLASCVFERDNNKRGEAFLISHSLRADLSTRSLSDTLRSVSAFVKSEVRHPTENLALLFLKQAVSIKPALVLQSNEAHQLLTSDEVRIAGWGYTQTPEPVGLLRGIWNSISGNESDTRQLGTKYIGKSHLGSRTNAGFDFGQYSNDALACLGDEGGPVIINVETPFKTRERLIGMVSYDPISAYACASPSYGIAFEPYQRFIDDNMIAACKNGERVWCEEKGLMKPEYDAEDDAFMYAPENQVILESPPAPVPAPKPSIPARVTPLEPAKKRPDNKAIQVKMESVGCSCRQVKKNQQ